MILLLFGGIVWSGRLSALRVGTRVETGDRRGRRLGGNPSAVAEGWGKGYGVIDGEGVWKILQDWFVSRERLGTRDAKSIKEQSGMCNGEKLKGWHAVMI